MLANFSITASEEELREFITGWVNLLADRKYLEAYDLVSPNDCSEWTPELMKSIINGYGAYYLEGNAKFDVTKTHKALGKGNRFDVMWFKESGAISQIEEQERIAEIWYQLPLNNEWSDLTVTFDLMQCSDKLHLRLNEIHVF